MLRCDARDTGFIMYADGTFSLRNFRFHLRLS